MNHKCTILLVIMISAVMTACVRTPPINELDKSYQPSSMATQTQPDTSSADVFEKPEHDMYFDDKFNEGYQKYYNYMRGTSTIEIECLFAVFQYRVP